MSVFFYGARKKWAVNFEEDGKKKRRLFSSEQEARSFYAEHMQSQEEPERLTLGEIVIKFFQAHEDYHHETKKKIIYLLSGHEKDGKHVEGAGEFLRNKYADSLTRKDLDQMRQNIKRGKAGNETCNKFQAYIRAVLQWAVQEEYLVLNPWRDLKRLPKKQRIFTANIDHFKRIISHAPEWLQWSFWTCYALSLRFGLVELFSLTWDAFQWRQGFVNVRQGKSGRIKRVFPPAEYMQAAFVRCQADMSNGIPLVCHRGGKRVLTYMAAWKAAVKKAGLEGMGIRPYDIRHVSASEMLANGADLVAVSAQLGHSSVVTTGTFYAHVTAGSQQRASTMPPSLSSEQLVNNDEGKEKG